jgi:hypothetical protein
MRGVFEIPAGQHLCPRNPDDQVMLHRRDGDVDYFEGER